MWLPGLTYTCCFDKFNIIVMQDFKFCISDWRLLLVHRRLVCHANYYWVTLRAYMARCLDNNRGNVESRLRPEVSRHMCYNWHQCVPAFARRQLSNVLAGAKTWPQQSGQLCVWSVGEYACHSRGAIAMGCSLANSQRRCFRSYSLERLSIPFHRSMLHLLYMYIVYVQI